MKKFSLMSAAALATLAAAGTGAEGDDDGDAGPAPGQGGSDAAPANPTPTPADTGGTPAAEPADQGGAEATADVVLATDAAASIRAADAAGYARANARMSTVFASDEGKANPALAAFMLSESTASADSIVAHLKAQGAPAAPAAATAPVIPNTSIDLGRGTDPAALVGDDGAGAQAEDGWAKARANTAERGGFVAPTSVAAAAVAARNAGGQFVTATVPPTGN